MIVDLSWIDSFATYSGGIITFTPISGSAGTYSVPITLSDNYPSSTSYLLFISVIKATTPKTTGPYTVNTGPPHFLGSEVLPPVQLEVGQGLRIILPQVIDDDGDTYSVSIPNFITSGIYLFTEWNKN